MHQDELLLSADAVENVPWYGRFINVALMLFAVMMIAAIATYKFNSAKLSRANSSLTFEMEGVPPAVEPLELKQVAPSEAREINAAVPFSSATVPPAKPFTMNGSPLNIARATDCLASAIFYEAGAETLGGQMAVAQVILNRMRHPAFPHSVCGVVYQGSTRRTGCQFSFSCDGSMRRIPSAISWQNVRHVATMMLNGTVYKPVGVATHYHTDWVVPAWSAKLDKIRAEGTHLFFRWTGWWGTPPAFRNSWAGSEPQVGSLANLSPGHAQTLAGEVALDAGGASFEATGPIAASTSTYINPTNDFMIFVIDQRSDPSLLSAKAISACGTLTYCKVMMWTDRAAAPTALPISDAQLASLAFSYLRNQAGGYEKALWNCAVFKRADPKQCMKTRMTYSVAPVERSDLTKPAPVIKNGTMSDLTPAEPEAEAATALLPQVGPNAQSTSARRRPGSE
jgi:spore germination cell wall hydrolase CwlJ-like protein